MEGYHESGPLLPKNEAEKVGSALYLALKKRYLDYPQISKTYLAKGEPRIVKIIFEYHKYNTNQNSDDLLNDFQEDVEEILDSYNIPDNLNVEYAVEDNTDKRSEVVTISLKEIN